jgi:hypothetical protein
MIIMSGSDEENYKILKFNWFEVSVRGVRIRVQKILPNY